MVLTATVQVYTAPTKSEVVAAPAQGEEPSLTAAEPKAAPATSGTAEVTPATQPSSEPSLGAAQEKVAEPATFEATVPTPAADAPEATQKSLGDTVSSHAGAIGGIAAAGAAALGGAAVAATKATGIDVAKPAPVSTLLTPAGLNYVSDSRQISVEDAKNRGIDVASLPKVDGPTDALSPAGSAPPVDAVNQLQNVVQGLDKPEVPAPVAQVAEKVAAPAAGE